VSPEQALSLEAGLVYRSSLAFALEVEPLFGLRERVSVRVQRAELTFAPRVRLGQSRDALALVFAAGWVLRSVVPELHRFELPSYVLSGPQLRVELVAPLGRLVRVRIGPELQWHPIVDRSLRDPGACCQGVAIGAQGSLEASLGETFGIALELRQSNVYVGSGERGFSEVERFAIAAFGGRL
jgi:hypothetical protein